MTPEEMDALTIKQCRQIAERAAEAFKMLESVGIIAKPVAQHSSSTYVPRHPAAAPSSPPTPAEPYPCAICGRAGPVTPQEQAQFREGMPECGACGNVMVPVGTRHTNKGHPIVTITAAERAAKLAQPALDEHGDPT